jgi:hypothetical protein
MPALQEQECYCGQRHYRPADHHRPDECDTCYAVMHCTHCRVAMPRATALASGRVVQTYSSQYMGADPLVFCAACHTTQFHRCDQCGQTHYREFMREFNGIWLCDADCYYDRVTCCDRCSTPTLRADLHVVAGGWGDRVCTTCAEEMATWCEPCGLYVVRAVGCAHIYDHVPNDITAPHRYSYKPHPRFAHATGEAAAPYYMGLELELAHLTNHTDTDALTAAIRDLDWLYVKSDCSVGVEGDVHRTGVELVTHPLSPAWMAEHRGDWNRLLRLFRQRRCVTGERANAGLHIHVSRSAFADATHLYRFMRLFYAHKRFTLAMSGRAPALLSEWASVDTTLRTVRAKARAGTNVDPSGWCDAHELRRSAVNLAPEHTAEVRIFAGTFEEVRFHAAWELVHAAVEFTRTATIRATTESEFRAWVTAHAGEFPHLVGVLTQ